MGGLHLTMYRAAIGHFYLRLIYFSMRRKKKVSCLFQKSKLNIYKVFTLFACVQLLLIISGDVKPNPGPVPYINIRHTNIRSLNEEKMDHIIENLSKFNIITLSETWLKKEKNYDYLKLPGYHPLIRKDRENNRYGGVAIWISENFIVKRRLDFENDL